MTLKTRNIISGVVIAALAVGAFVFVWKVMLFGPPGDYEVKAVFKDSGGVTKNSDVKIGGVPAGTVQKFKLTKDDTAMVTMRLDEGYPIGAGAVANSRPVNLLGEKYIELKPGDMSKPQKSGVTIPESRTSRPTELDDMLNILQPDVRARLRILINEAGIAMDGRGADFNDILDKLPPALDQTQKVVADFGRDNDVLKSAITQSDRVIGSFARQDKDLQQLVDSATGTLKITADKRRQIAATLQQAPGSLRQLTTTLSDLGGTATKLEPLSRQVRQAAPPLTQALDAAPDFAKDASPALAAASKVSPKLTQLGKEARKPVERLQPTLGQLDQFAGRLQPVIDNADKNKGLVRLLNVMDAWNKVIQRTDGLGHTFGTQITIDQSLITHALEKYLSPAKQRTVRSITADPQPKAPAPERSEPKAPEPKQSPVHPPKLQIPKLKLPDIKLPDLPDLPLPQSLKKTLDDIGSGVDNTLDKLQGKNTGQRQGSKGPTGKLLDYLLGS